MQPLSWIRIRVQKYRLLRILLYPVIGVKRMVERCRRDPLEVWRHLAKVLVVDPIVYLDEYKGTFAVGPKSHIFRQIVFSGHYERNLAEWFQLRIDPERDVIDIGANVGFYTVLAAHRVTTGRVWAVEPVEAALQRLRGNIDRNNVSEKVTVFAGVATSSTGVAMINVVSGMEEYSSLGQLAHPSVANMQSSRCEVAATTLDDLARRDGIDPGIIKMDVEGAEEMVLAGAPHVLNTSRPIILTEVSKSLLRQNDSSLPAILALLKQHEYEAFDLQYPEVAVGTRPACDVVCIPREAVETKLHRTGH